MVRLANWEEHYRGVISTTACLNSVVAPPMYFFELIYAVLFYLLGLVYGGYPDVTFQVVGLSLLVMQTAYTHYAMGLFPYCRDFFRYIDPNP